MSQPCRIYLIDPAYFGPGTSSWNGIPINVGYVASYAETRFNGDCRFRVFRDPLALLEHARKDPPDVLGISRFAWNRVLTTWIAQKVRAVNPDCLVVIGGPEVDSDAEVQLEVMAEYDGACDLLVPDEGEVGFVNILERFLSGGRNEVFSTPIDGVVFADGDNTVQGNMAVGLSVDLATVPSPILSGMMDEFLTVDYFPFIQTSRVCPYSCTFCTSGRSRGKLRHFPLETVEAEIRYLAGHYRDRPHQGLYLADDDFGINEQDLQIATTIMNTRIETGWPQNVQCTLDKKFSERNREITKILAPVDRAGYYLPLQSMNDDTLRAIRRKNITPDNIDHILEWADENGIEVFSELIFGLPLETKQSFLAAIDFCIEHGINCGVFSLAFFPGTQLNRRDAAEEFGFVKKYRQPYGVLFAELEGELVGEYEQISVGTDTLSFEDYLDVRKVMVLVHAVILVGYYRLIVQFLSRRGYDGSQLFDEMMNVPAGGSGEATRRKFIEEFLEQVTGELHDTPEGVFEQARKWKKGGGDGSFRTPRTNTAFAARAVYETDWIGEWFRQWFEGAFCDDDEIFKDLLNICAEEWIDLKAPVERKTLEISSRTAHYLGYDEIAGSDDRGPCLLTFGLSDEQRTVIQSFVDDCRDSTAFYYDALTQLDRFNTLRYEVRQCRWAQVNEDPVQTKNLNEDKQPRESRPVMS